MPDPISATGAQRNPTRFGALGMGARQFTGLWTQRSPYRDAATAYLVGKFYSGSRFDSILDGANREISQRLTDIRRPGSSVYNSQTFPAIQSFYPWKYIQNGSEVLRVMADTAANVYDATGPSTKLNIWNKAPNAGSTRFLGVNTELFFDDGVEQKKVVESALTWKANTQYDGAATSNVTLGDFIVDTNDNLQQAVGGFSIGITDVAISSNVLTLTFDQTQLQNPQGQPSGTVGTSGSLPTGAYYATVAASNALGLYTAAGSESALTAVVGPNGSIQWIWAPVAGPGSYRIYIGNTPGGEDYYFQTTSNTFTQTTTLGQSGTPPIVNNAYDPNLPDNLQFMAGAQLALSGLTAATFLNGQTVTIASVLPGGSGSNVITATFAHADYSSTADTGTATSGTGTSGSAQPTWATTWGAVTQDNAGGATALGAQWICKGSRVQKWGIAAPANAPGVAQQQSATGIPAWNPNTYYTTCGLITDPAGFLQQVTTYGSTAGAIPTFDDTTGGTTVDGGVIWTCLGPSAYTTGMTVAKGQYIEAANTAGDLCYYQAQNAGTAGATRPAFPVPLGSQVNDNGVVWQNVGIGQVWNNITSAGLNAGFTVIPLSGGGSIAIGAGQGATYGETITLPNGFTTSGLLVWTTAGTGDTGHLITGVASSSGAGGVLQSAFQILGGGVGNVSTNWFALAYTAGAAVAITNVGSFTQIAFTTANGDQLAFTFGQQAGGTIPIPAGFSLANFTGIVGMATVVNTSHNLYGVDESNYNPANLNAQTQYNDNNSNIWGGNGNFAGLFWMSGGGVTTQTLTGGSAVIIPLPNSKSIAFLTQQGVNPGASFTVPAGFSGGSIAATCSMARYNSSGTSPFATGWTLAVAGTVLTAEMVNFGSPYTNSKGNVLAILTAVTGAAISPAREIDDSNGNLQQLQQSGLSGEAAPVWATTAGILTDDNNAIWINIGTGSAAATANTKYYYAYGNSVTAHVGTASPASVLIQPNAGYGVLVQGVYSNDPQVDTIYIFRPAQGESTPLLADTIPNLPYGPGATWSYLDTVPDVSKSGGKQLNALITAPLAHANDPPPDSMTGPVYHLQRVWAIVNNTVVYSGGPDTLLGSGNEAFPPLNEIPFPSQPIFLSPITVQNGGLLVWTTAGIWIILGTGTSTNPFYATIYYANVSILNANAVTQFNTAFFCMESDGKVSQILPEYPFNPQTGYTEVGFPIGDQFQAVTTGGYDAALFSPATAYVSWNNQNTADCALYVADGAGHWFRMSQVSPPESGMMWHPIATLNGGSSAVMSVETTPGRPQLLIGPAASGPILFRDSSVNADWVGPATGGSYQGYEAYDVKGVNILCSTGQWAEVAHIATKCMPVGARPQVSVLLGEIAPTGQRPYAVLDLNQKSNDPPRNPRSVSAYSDRYVLAQNGVETTGDCILTRFDFGSQTVADELLDWQIFASIHDEREEAAAK